MQLDKQLSDPTVEGSVSFNLKSLDALRGLLALYVVAGHCRWMLWQGYSTWSQQPHPLWQKGLAVSTALLRYGHEAVIVFFVLSGFFIHLRIAKQLAESPTFQFDLIQFIRRRSHRLIPPYVFALAVTVLFDVVGMLVYPTLYHAATGDALLDINFARKGYSLSSVLPALVLLPKSLGKDFGSNGPFWSLSCEIIYYAAYPLWLLLRKQGALLAYGIGAGIAVVSSYLLPGQMVAHDALIYYPVWLCGAAIAELLAKRSQLCTFQSAATWSVAFVGFAIAFVGINVSTISGINLLGSAMLGTSVVLAVLNLPTLLWRSPFHKFFERLGLKSYTIYICHFPMVTLIRAWVIETQGSRPENGWLALGGFIGSLLLCNLCFSLCEQRFLHARIKLSPQ